MRVAFYLLSLSRLRGRARSRFSCGQEAIQAELFTPRSGGGPEKGAAKSSSLGRARSRWPERVAFGGSLGLHGSRA